MTVMSATYSPIFAPVTAVLLSVVWPATAGNYAPIAKPAQSAVHDKTSMSFHDDGLLAPPVGKSALETFPKKVYPAAVPDPIVDAVWIDEAKGRLINMLRNAVNITDPSTKEIASFAVSEANTLLDKLARAGLQVRPALGWDGEDVVSIYVSSADFSADISVFGDGTYSYAAQRGGAFSECEAAPISGAVPTGLEKILAV